MYYYFLSSYPAVIKLNGIYYGNVHNAVKSCNIEEISPFIEVCPLNGLENPTCFILDQSFISNVPEGVILTDLDGGYLLNFTGGFLSAPFSVIAQQKFSDAVVTVFSENGYKLSIETKNDFFAENLLNKVDSCEISRKENLLTVCFYGQKKLVNVYDLSGGIAKIFSREVDSYEFGDRLITVENLSDMAKHKITTEWEYVSGSFKVKSKSVERAESFDEEKLSPKLIPYAFLEEMLAGGECGGYLGGSVKDNADKLSEFLGEFVGIMPPPAFREVEEVGLVYANGKNRYKVKYFKFEVKERKIVNITC